MRMGQWSQTVMEKAYLTFFTPALVLAAGGFRGAATHDYKQFWHARFTREIPPPLIAKIFPFLAELKRTWREMEGEGKKVPSVRSLVFVLEYLAAVVFQDALELVRTGRCFVPGEDGRPVCHNRCIRFLLNEPEFQRELHLYQVLHSLQVRK